MAAIYGNSEFIKNKRSHVMDKCAHERDVSSAKRTKVLLIVLSVSLGFALAGICALSFLYAVKCSSCDTIHNFSNLPADPVNETNMDFLDKYTKVKEHLAACTAFISSSCEPCEDGWTAHGGKCYFFSSEEQSWFESHNSCEALKSHLVTINTSAVQDFLASTIEETHWIGLNDQDTEGRWVWVNNQTLEETGLQFWFKKASGSEPDDSGGEDCACLGYMGAHLNSWFDASCETKKKFICEKKYSLAFIE